MKYKFDHSKGTVSEAIGISEERRKEIADAAKEVCALAFFIDKTIDDKSRMIEVFLNQVQPKDTIEAFFAGDMFSQTFAYFREITQKAAK